MRDVLQSVVIERYPDRDALALRRAIARHHDVSMDQIIVGNGSMELLWFLALAYLRPGDPVLILEPTFGEYHRVAKLMGAQPHAYTTTPETGFQIDAAAVSQRLQQRRPRLMFLCNPNNPTGTLLPVRTLVDWATRHPDTLFVVDEAYLPFVSTPVSSMIEHLRSNILILHSMTKAHALAGVRLGYAVGTPDVIATLAKVRPTWNVNAIAQAAGIVALADVSHLKATLTHVAGDKIALVKALEKIGFAPRSSCTHFFLCDVGQASVLAIASPAARHLGARLHLIWATRLYSDSQPAAE